MKKLSVITVLFVILLAFVSCKNQEPTAHQRIVTYGDYRFEVLSDPNCLNNDMNVLVINTKKQPFHWVSEFEADMTTADTYPGVYGTICNEDFNDLRDTCQKIIKLHQTSKLTIYPCRRYTDKEVKTMIALSTDNGIVIFESAEKFFDIY